jgi:hypothetical protein
MEPEQASEWDVDGLVEYSPAVIALSRSPYAGIRRVRCFVHDGVARLDGRLPSYHQKQLAQELVRRADGVEFVDNRIVVESDF